jgi:hypothetical protein
VRVEDVVDGKSLNAYLDGLSQDEQRKARLRVVFRPAARIFPIASRDLLKSSMKWPQEAIAISGFVKISISGLALKTSNPDIAADIVTLAIKRAGSALSTMGRSYDYDVANTAELAARALFQGADCAAKLGDPWEEIRADLRGASGAIWSDGIPSEIEKIWSSAKDAMMANPDDWSFWIAWYERVLHGRDWCADEVGAVLSKIKEKDFDHGPLHINPMFGEVLARYRAEDELNVVTKAAPVDFSFDAMVQVMRLVGIDDNMHHLRHPEVVQAFLDDAEQVSDLFQDFIDDAQTLSGGGNFAGLLCLKAENILKEFRRVEDKTHLRAEYLVIQASELEVFANEPKARSDLQPILAGRLDERIAQLKRLCRKHFGPSYATLAPLADLNFDQIDQDEVIALFDKAIADIEHLPAGKLYGLDAEGIAVLHDMRHELTVVRAAIAESSSVEFKQVLETRLAQSSGGLGLSLIKFYQRTAEAGKDAGRTIDIAMKTKKRGEGMIEIFDLLSGLSNSGGG